MKTITNAVRDIFKQDEVAREAARRGILNSSAYARKILKEVGDQTWKEVEEPSVAIAISRVTQQSAFLPVKPELTFDRVSIDSGLVDVTYERSQEIAESLNQVIPLLRKKYGSDLYLETSGQRQITMVMTEAMWLEMEKLLPAKSIGLYKNLVAISISFNERYLAIPNFFYAVIGLFAVENINLIEIFSTMTEIVIIIDESCLDIALSEVKKFMK